MPVTKTNRECYEVRDGRGEWANITLHCWTRTHSQGTQHEGTYHCGEITIQSSFGCWGYIWTACGSPFKRFLQRASFDYVFTKFMGDKLARYDGDATVRKLRSEVIEQRKRRRLDMDEARKVWDAIAYEADRIESGSETDFGYAMFDIARALDDKHPMREHFADPCAWDRCTRHDPQAAGFWRCIWPLFIDALKEEEKQPA